MYWGLRHAGLRASVCLVLAAVMMFAPPLRLLDASGVLIDGQPASEFIGIAEASAGILPDPVSVVHVGGTLTSSTTWTSGTVYVVDSSLTVNAGVTLTIEPCVVVKMPASGMLTVDGLLDVSRTRSATPVVRHLRRDRLGLHA